MSLLPTVVAAVFAGGGGAAVILLLRLPADLRKTKVDTSATLNDIALELVEPLRSELSEARKEVGQLREQMQEMRDDLAEYHRLYGPLPATT